MTSRDKPIIIITGALLKFKIKAARWERTVASSGNGHTVMSVKVWKALPAGDVRAPQAVQPDAEFSDVHAIYFEDQCEMVTEPDEAD